MTSMPATHKVSVTWQIVATFVPIANLWAFYRIRKLRRYVLYVVVPSIILSASLVAYYYAGQPRFTPWGDDGLAFGDPRPDLVVTVLGQVIGWGLQGFAIYLAIIWSRQHNRRFDTMTQP